MPNNLLLILFLLCTLFSCKTESEKKSTQTPKTYPEGSLFIIGGGDRGDSLMQELIDVSGWKKGDLITAITLPSGWGDSAYIWLNNDFKRLTGQNCVRFDSAAVHNPKSIDSLSRSKIIFISGGDQSVMMRLIKGTDVKQVIQNAYNKGALIGGTSAGAAIMSEKMITGDGLIDTVYESTFSVIWKGNLELTEGLGLLDSVIIDMHFVARSRYNRLLSAQIENPHFQCVGIDEATAVIVHNDTATVAGESQVLVFSMPYKITSGPDHLMGEEGIVMNIYLPGEKFRIKN